MTDENETAEDGWGRRRRMSRRSINANPAGTYGFTLLELVIVVAIVGILAAAVLPLARWSVKRQKEYELQQNLRILRIAIDRYHDLALAGLIETDPGDTGYPPDLKSLVEGVELTGPLPAPVPGVSDAFSATGAGLTGGVAGTVEAANAGAAAVGPGGGVQVGVPSGAAQQQALGRALGQLQESSNPLSQRLSPSQRAAAGRLGESLMQQARQGALGGSRLGTQGGTGGRGARGGRDRAGRAGESTTIVFLRRIPVDPFGGDADWGMRCYGDRLADRSWCGRNVFDVYSKALGRGIDGRPYREW
jgi:prepilin-type N-terminal cleavage/methylation domain-containing protein